MCEIKNAALVADSWNPEVSVSVQHVPGTVRIAVAGTALESVYAGRALKLRFSGGWEIRIEGLFGLRSATSGFLADLDSANPESCVAVQSLVGCTVLSATANQTSGLLSVSFGAGGQITVGPDKEYAAWTVAGPSGEKLVCLPGGGATRWPKPSQ